MVWFLFACRENPKDQTEQVETVVIEPSDRLFPQLSDCSDTAPSIVAIYGFAQW